MVACWAKHGLAWAGMDRIQNRTPQISDPRLNIPNPEILRSQTSDVISISHSADYEDSRVRVTHLSGPRCQMHILDPGTRDSGHRMRVTRTWGAIHEMLKKIVAQPATYPASQRISHPTSKQPISQPADKSVSQSSRSVSQSIS